MIDTTQIYNDLLKVAQMQNSAEVYLAAQQMMQKLKSEVLGSATGDTSLTYNDVSSLNNFVQHLQDKRIQYNGAYLILGPATIEEAKKDPTNKLEGLYIPIYDGKLYLYKDGLIAYIEQLKGQVSANNAPAGRLLSLALGKIEAQAQSTFNLQPQKEPAQKETPGQPVQEERYQSTPYGKNKNRQVSLTETEEAEVQTGQETLKQTIVKPYSRDDINILNMTRFLQFFIELPQNNPDIKKKLGPDEAQSLYATSSQVMQLLRNFQSTAPEAAKNGFKFTLSGSVSPDVFISTYANNNRGTAINMLSTMTKICNLLNSILSNLRDTTALADLAGGTEVIEDQINLGNSYITNFEHFMTSARS